MLDLGDQKEIHILKLRHACEGVEVYICQAFAIRMATSDHDIAVSNKNIK